MFAIKYILVMKDVVNIRKNVPGDSGSSKFKPMDKYRV